MRLGAALFNGNHARLGDEVQRLTDAGLDLIHLDVFDGYFVPDLGFPPRTIEHLRPLTTLPFEVHLGANDPARFIRPLADAGVDLLFLPVETTPLLYETIFTVRECKMRVGLSFALGAPLTALEAAAPMLDAILLLSRVTGESARGASFNPLALPRVTRAHEILQAANINVDLQIAGGINRENIVQAKRAGATTASLGAGIYKVADMRREVAELRALTED
ncbi:MAG TPA: ribulose-phosphate 3-epimerase [Anaerolineae bacterium]|nr:ribulose-phosphate 3-epimerase [Anaerolineae bacterium]